ncbi:MAG: hypothetical protein WC356_03200 [Candidatus Micrarchaeia archaeon]|jgi:hypothetical protein
MKAFAFTFDSFIAFILAITLLYGLFMVISLPNGYFSEFEQTYILAKDTATMLRYADDVSGDAYIDLIAESFVGAGSPDASRVCMDIRNNIPNQYGFVLEYFDDTSNTWQNMNCDEKTGNNYYCSDYKKAKAAAPIILTAYSVLPNSTIKQYGYIQCDGNYTLCGNPGSTFIEGDVEVKLLRLIVCV